MVILQIPVILRRDKELLPSASECKRYEVVPVLNYTSHHEDTLEVEI
jgi:hypothetical protein